MSVSEAKRKGVIEVINITQPHMAECRILESNNSHPLVPKDVIFTPLWHPGLQEHFALVGALDIEGKGNNDRQKVHDIIRVHGGIIDAETDDKGKLQGEITHLTRYLVEGDLKDHESDKPSPGISKLIDDAKTMGVEVIDLARFLDLMGYTAGADEKSGLMKNLRARKPASRSTTSAPEFLRPRPERRERIEKAAGESSSDSLWLLAFSFGCVHGCWQHRLDQTTHRRDSPESDRLTVKSNRTLRIRRV